MPQQPPALPSTLPLSNNLYTPRQEQVVNVTPNEHNSNLDQNQNQTSTSNGVGNANATSAPSINGSSYNSNTQINTGYGENTEECMFEVGCRDTINLSLEAYYGRADINSSSDGLWGNGAYNKNLGVGLRLNVPLGNGFNGSLDKLAAEEVKKRTAETQVINQQLIAENLKIDREIIQSCVNLKNEIDGKKVVITPENASPVVQRIDNLCKGLNVLVEQKTTNNDELSVLKLENERMRAQLLRLQQTNIKQKVGN